MEDGEMQRGWIPLWGARPSRALAKLSLLRELSTRKRLFRRDAKTDARDGRATQNKSASVAASSANRTDSSVASSALPRRNQ